MGSFKISPGVELYGPKATNQAEALGYEDVEKENQDAIFKLKAEQERVAGDEKIHNNPIYNYRESNGDGVVTLAFFWKEPSATEVAEMGLPERPEGADSYSLAVGWYKSDDVPFWAINGARRVEELQWLETKYALNDAFEVPNV